MSGLSKRLELAEIESELKELLNTPHGGTLLDSHYVTCKLPLKIRTSKLTQGMIIQIGSKVEYSNMTQCVSYLSVHSEHTANFLIFIFFQQR